MSRTLLTAATLALFVLPATAAHAQLGFGLAAGPSAALGDFGKAVDAGYHATGIVTVSVPLAPIGLRLEGSFNEFNNKSTIASATQAKSRIYSGTANVVLSTPGIVGPYLVGGIGMYNMSAVCTGCSSSETKVGYNGGGGFMIGLGGLSAFVEARYHYVPTSGSSTQFIPVSFGLTF